jgi:hypothetical protein
LFFLVFFYFWYKAKQRNKTHKQKKQTQDKDVQREKHSPLSHPAKGGRPVRVLR